MPLIMLCGVGLRFNLVRDELLGGVSDKRSPEDRELLVGFQAAEAFSRFHHSGGGPGFGRGNSGASFRSSEYSGNSRLSVRTDVPT
jgi:hypothetical protein